MPSRPINDSRTKLKKKRQILNFLNRDEVKSKYQGLLGVKFYRFEINFFESLCLRPGSVIGAGCGKRRVENTINKIIFYSAIELTHK